jgi:fructokinase
VLFDRFPDGDILGGAPFNVAWHLQGYGASPLLVSRVGRDATGDRVLAAMRAWGLTTAAVARDPDAPTGLVMLTLTDEGHTFDILPDRAYDRIEADQLPEGAEASLIVHGTLALRTDGARDALRRLRDETDAPLFCDLNLRPPWDVPEAVAWSLENADWLKLNDEELARVTGRPCPDRAACVEAAAAVLDTSPCRTVYVTCGPDGALARTREGTVHAAAGRPPEAIVDTVGAGDAFTAVAILGLLRDWPLDETIERAVRFAASVCGQRGATSENRSLYAADRRESGDPDD